MDRRQFLRQISAGAAATLSARTAVRAQGTGDRSAEIERLMKQLHDQRMFTGVVLVAQRGNVIYSGAFGVADAASGRPYTAATRSCLASLSKPITATAIMMLAEKRELKYDDPLSRFLPGFTETVGAVTLRQLLTHTSGIPATQV